MAPGVVHDGAARADSEVALPRGRSPEGADPGWGDADQAATWAARDGPAGGPSGSERGVGVAGSVLWRSLHRGSVPGHSLWEPAGRGRASGRGSVRLRGRAFGPEALEPGAASARAGDAHAAADGCARFVGLRGSVRRRADGRGPDRRGGRGLSGRDSARGR